MTDTTTADEHGWLPIETAPKDGTYVLLADANWPKEGLLIGRWKMESWWTRPTPSGKSTIWEEATHWRPLPPPPAARAKEGKA